MPSRKSPKSAGVRKSKQPPKDTPPVAATEPSASTEILIEDRHLDDLREHPRQAEIFGDLPQAELQHLAKDMERQGLVTPVEITDDNVVIAGHQRIRAARLLGWKKITCWIRCDLVAEGEEAVERRLIEDNLNRRQLDKLGQARAYRRLKQLERPDSLVRKQAERLDLRDILARQFGISGRSLDRWSRLLETPREVQAAFSAKRLKLNLAERVADLAEDKQLEIAARIRGGEEPRIVVTAYLPRKDGAAINLGTSLGRLLRAIGSASRELGGRVSELSGGQWTADLPLLRSGRDLLDRLIARIESLPVLSLPETGPVAAEAELNTETGADAQSAA